MYMCVCIYLECNPGTVHRHTPVSEYSVPMVNLEWPPKHNSKL